MNPPAGVNAPGGNAPAANGNPPPNGNATGTAQPNYAKAAVVGAALAVGLGLTSYVNSTGIGGPGTATSAPSSFPPGHVCPIQGDGGDASLNVQKNRFVAPAASDITPKIATPAAMIALTEPSELKSLKSRAQWPNDPATQQVIALEGQAVTIEGYLIGAREENTDGGEACNCHTPQTLFDYHLYMADEPAVPISKAVVVEMTPRWRAANPSWGDADNNYSGFNQILALKDQRVRVTGWLLFDEEHLDVVGQERATVWEVHPVTTFEYQKDGVWTNL